MYTILLSRSYPLPNGKTTLRVDLLQHTDTLAKVWEVTVLFRSARHGVQTGSITRRKTRSEAMRIVRRALHSS